MIQLVKVKDHEDESATFHRMLFNVFCQTLEMAGKTPTEIALHFGIPTNEVLKALDSQARFPTAGEMKCAPAIEDAKKASPFRYMTTESFEDYRQKINKVITLVVKEQRLKR